MTESERVIQSLREELDAVRAELDRLRAVVSRASDVQVTRAHPGSVDSSPPGDQGAAPSVYILPRDS